MSSKSDGERIPLPGPLLALMTQPINNIQEFISVWTSIFSEAVSAEQVGFLQRQVGEMQMTAPDMYDDIYMAAVCSAQLSKLCFQTGATITGLTTTCYAELLQLVMREKCTAHDAIQLLADWWHNYRTASQRLYMAENNLSDADVRKLQKEFTNSAGDLANEKGLFGVRSRAVTKDESEALVSNRDLPAVTMKVIKGGLSN